MREAVYPRRVPRPAVHICLFSWKTLQVQESVFQIRPLFTRPVLLNVFPDIYNLHMAGCD